MSANTYFIDSATRRAVFVERYSRGLENQSKEEIAAIFDRVDALIRDTDLSSSYKVDQLRQNIRVLISTEINDSLNGIADQIIDFAISEAEFSAEMFGGAVNADIQTPSASVIRSSVYMNGFSFNPGVNVLRAIQGFGQRKAAQVVQAVDDGLVEGQTSTQISSRVRGLLNITRTQSGSLVRTSINHSTTQARMRTLEANKDIFDGYEWVSTLDARTSIICIARDGVVYRFSPESPVPPAHWSCRSTVVPKVKDKFNLLKSVDGERPSVGPDGPQVVSAKTTYSSWLKRQPKSFQDEVLGPSRAKLLRDGKLEMSRFVDDSGRVYTLDQLRALNPLAFERAGLTTGEAR